MDRKEIILLLLLILIGSVLRFFNLGEMSLFNDELSALSRTNVDNFRDLIEIGVRQDIAHPAGAQVIIYYWTNIFGNSEFSLRFPFVIFGILCIPVSYFVASSWFNKWTGLFTAAAICLLQFPLFYSQLARPYSPGLFFSLLTVLFWTKILFTKFDKKNYWHYAGYILAAAGAAYSHYFSLIFVGVVGITGLLFMRRSNYIMYLLSGAVIIGSFIPHVGILLDQMAYDEPNWIPLPENGFLRVQVFYAFNKSFFVHGSFWLILILSFLYYRKEIVWRKFHTICIVWFLLPFLILFYYSRFLEPVIQNSSLLFSFPYLLMFGFSFLHFKNFNYRSGGLLLAFCGLLFYSLIVEKKYYKTEHFGDFKNIALSSIKWVDTYGDSNITKVINVKKPSYINYYFDKYDRELSFDQYSTDTDGDLEDLKKLITGKDNKYFLFVWSNRAISSKVYELIHTIYPIIVEDDPHFNARATLFKRVDVSGRQVYGIRNNFDSRPLAHGWGNEQTVSFEQARSGLSSVKLSRKAEFSPTFSMKAGEIGLRPGSTILVTAYVFLINPDSDVHLVLSIEDKGTSKHYQNVLVSQYINEPFQWKKLYLEYKAADNIQTGDLVKAYVWNAGKRDVYIDDIEITVYSRN